MAAKQDLFTFSCGKDFRDIHDFLMDLKNQGGNLSLVIKLAVRMYHKVKKGEARLVDVHEPPDMPSFEVTEVSNQEEPVRPITIEEAEDNWLTDMVAFDGLEEVKYDKDGNEVE